MTVDANQRSDTGPFDEGSGSFMTEDTDRASETRSLDVEALYKHYAPLVFRRARCFYDEHEAEEVVHEVFMRILDKQRVSILL